MEVEQVPAEPLRGGGGAGHARATRASARLAGAAAGRCGVGVAAAGGERAATKLELGAAAAAAAAGETGLAAADAFLNLDHGAVEDAAVSADAARAAGLALGAYKQWQRAQAVHISLREARQRAERERRASLDSAASLAASAAAAAPAPPAPAPLPTPPAEASNPRHELTPDFEYGFGAILDADLDVGLDGTLGQPLDGFDAVWQDVAVDGAAVGTAPTVTEDVDWVRAIAGAPFAADDAFETGDAVELPVRLASPPPSPPQLPLGTALPLDQPESHHNAPSRAAAPTAATADTVNPGSVDIQALRLKAAAAKARAAAAAKAASAAADRARAMIEVVSGAEVLEARAADTLKPEHASGPMLTSPAAAIGSDAPLTPAATEAEAGDVSVTPTAPPLQAVVRHTPSEASYAHWQSGDTADSGAPASMFERAEGKRKPKAVRRFGDALGGAVATVLLDEVPPPPAKRQKVKTDVKAERTPLASVAGSISPEDGPRRGCLYCHRQHTPQWRLGPTGPKTLCNACGVRWMKSLRGKATFALTLPENAANEGP